MPRGTAITPAQVEALVAAFREHGTYNAAARAVGIDPSAARKCLIRMGEPLKSEHYARARERGIRKASRLVELAGAKLREQIASGALDPKDLATVSNAAAKTLDSLVAAQTNGVRLDETRARVAKTKAETALIEAKARGEVKDVTVIAATEQQVDELMRAKFGAPGVIYRHDDGEPSPA